VTTEDDMPDSNFTPLTDQQIDKIAEKAADRAVAKITDQVYREVGKGVVSKVFWIVGALAVAAFIWAKSKGLIQ
jgi:hypothetical protein